MKTQPRNGRQRSSSASNSPQSAEKSFSPPARSLPGACSLRPVTFVSVPVCTPAAVLGSRGRPRLRGIPHLNVHSSNDGLCIMICAWGPRRRARRERARQPSYPGTPAAGPGPSTERARRRQRTHAPVAPCHGGRDRPGGRDESYHQNAAVRGRPIRCPMHVAARVHLPCAQSARSEEQDHPGHSRLRCCCEQLRTRASRRGSRRGLIAPSRPGPNERRGGARGVAVGGHQPRGWNLRWMDFNLSASTCV